MSIAEHHNAPAAWYPDQKDPSQLRWWDGENWTEERRPMIAAVPELIEIEAPQFQAPPLLQTRRGINAVAQPAQGFGQASPEQLRAWPPPSIADRSDIPAPVSEVPRDWKVATNTTLPPVGFESPDFNARSVPTFAPSFESASPVAEPTGFPSLTLVPRLPPEVPMTLIFDSESAPAHHDPIFAQQQFGEPFAAEPFYQDQFAEPWPEVPVFEGTIPAPKIRTVVEPIPVDTARPGLTRRELRAMVGPLTTAQLRAE